MKYRTFRNLITVGGAAVLASLLGTCLYFSGGTQRGQAVGVTGPSNSGTVTNGGTGVVTNTQSPSQPNRAAGSFPAAASPAQPQGGQRREDQLILNFLASRPATTNKVQDAFPGESFKVNFYCDDGAPKWTRLKIDLDRDGKDDEKWDLKEGQPAKRRVATRDDEQYDREYRWSSDQWVVKN
ncbi:MAG TPA: hypothetical protein VGX48_23210 [Pyrinomonadaceae bacterium]|jgi:hypothetical protein|nr:hypothetical protein [Pyrinomonadaceae bacterium]